MPQCIAQQDQSAWLSAMTRCTGRQCTRHFGAICTHHQWLTQLSCLSTEFSPDLVSLYLPFCSRSVLAKAQLFHWIHTITGRTWLVDAGDANGLQTPSPTSLTRGYAALEVADKAPTCLTKSVVGSYMEPFHHVMALCGFTSDTRHTGNAARPWEYRESPRSMVALDFETAGYDLTRRRIAYGDYLDKRCFCDTLGTNIDAQPCPGPGLTATKERLWLNATCGPESLPANWTTGLQTTTFAYIPTENWRWPDCVAAMPRRTIALVDQCTTDACELDSDGYCTVTRAVDRACFCRATSYDGCKGGCHVFEARIDFVNWLHGLCGNVEDWHGLPKHWRRLAAPTRVNMMPWPWNVGPSKRSGARHGHSKSSTPCASTEWKLGALMLSNSAALLAGLYAARSPPRARPLSSTYPAWLATGLAIAALHVLAHCITAALVKLTAGYAALPTLQLVLLWTTMPRPTWTTLVLVALRRSSTTPPHATASCVLAETLLHSLSAAPMLHTVAYGWTHGFYSAAMARLDAAPAAQAMYAGAALWLLVALGSALLLAHTAFRAHPAPPPTTPTHSVFNHPHPPPPPPPPPPPYTPHPAPPCYEHTPLPHPDAHSYGTLPNKPRDPRGPRDSTPGPVFVVCTAVFLAWLAQCIFWAGFIVLSADEYVRTHALLCSSCANGGQGFVRRGCGFLLLFGALLRRGVLTCCWCRGAAGRLAVGQEDARVVLGGLRCDVAC